MLCKQFNIRTQRPLQRCSPNYRWGLALNTDMWETLVWLQHFTKRRGLDPYNWINSATCYWSVWRKPWYWGVMYMCVWGITYCLWFYDWTVLMVCLFFILFVTINALLIPSLAFFTFITYQQKPQGQN